MSVHRLRPVIGGVAIAALTTLGCDGHTETGPAPTAKPDLVFTQDGMRIALIRGDAYRVRSDGSMEFLQKLYDPDYRSKHFVRKDGRVYQRDPESGEAHPVTRRFHDDFEDARDVGDLLSPQRWHRYDTDPARSGQAGNYHAHGNRMQVSRERARSGRTSLRFHARPSSEMATKAAISKGILYFEKGDDVHFSGWFFVESTPSIYDAGAFTLVDLESSFQQYLGLRIIFGVEDSLTFELKMPKTHYTQPRGAEVSFPAGRWVHVRAHVTLSDANGRMRLWQDGRLVLDTVGRTLPLADTVYDSLEVGITVLAAGSRYEKVLYVDDIAISDAPLPGR